MIKSSPWFQTVPDVRRFSSLYGTQESDVVVIGGGIAGVMTAWQLAQRGVSVILLEKNHIATGDSGFTTAFITRVLDLRVATQVERYGVDVVKNIFKANRQAQDFLKLTIKQEQIDCDYFECSSVNVSYNLDDPILKQEWEAVSQVDPDARFVDWKEAGSNGEAIEFLHE